jgi:hypothetical protein
LLEIRVGCVLGESRIYNEFAGRAGAVPAGFADAGPDNQPLFVGEIFQGLGNRKTPGVEKLFGTLDTR